MARKPKTTAQRAAPPVMDEIATASANPYLNTFVGEVAATTDPILRGLGGDLTHYEALLRDDQVASTLQQRRRAVTSVDWTVTAASDSPEDKAAAEFVEGQVRGLKFDRITDKMLHGLFYGYAVGECLWAAEEGWIVLKDIKVRRAKRFRFGRDGNLRMIASGNTQGVAMPERKFWTFTAGGDNDDDLYGRGLGYWCYWPVFLKRNGVKFWSIALEKHGVPTTVGKYHPGATPTEQKKLLQAAAAVSTDAAVVIPEGMMLDFLEAKRQTGADHLEFCNKMDAAIAKVILSQTMTTDDGASLAQGQVHMDVRDEVVKGDIDLVCESFNDGPVRWLTEWNFPNANPPRVWREIEEPEDLKAVAERDLIVAGMGFDPSEEYIQGKYGPGWTKKPAPASSPEPPAQFAEAAVKDHVDALAGQADAAAAPALDDMIDAIRRVIEDSASFEEAQRRLLELYPTLDAGDLAETTRRAFVVADLTGRADVADNG